MLGRRDPGGGEPTLWEKGVAHARHALSGVAGLSRAKAPPRPASARAAATASLMAKNTELPRNRTGSPMPCRTRGTQGDCDATGDSTGGL